MNEKLQTWSMTRPNPISSMMLNDDHLIPAHVREAMAAPPKGYLNIPRDQRREPDSIHMFLTHIPASRADVDLYLASLQYPHTRKERLLHRVASMPVPSLGVTYSIFAITTFSVPAYFACKNAGQHTAASVVLYTAIALAIVFAAIVGCAITSFWAESHLRKHRNVYAQNAPTMLMRKIIARSIDARSVDSQLARFAWDVYCYDAEHYDELVALIQDMHDHPAERGTKTRRVYGEIIDTFRRASELRQDAAWKALADNAEAIEQQRLDEMARSEANYKLSDEMRANMLETTVLERLRAEASAAEDVYGSKD